MLWGAIIGAIIGVIYYALRLGGILLVRDLQEGLYMAIGQAILHALTPAIIGGFIGWLIS
jgi:hypothetical protein